MVAQTSLEPFIVENSIDNEWVKYIDIENI
jgi:hypothetical protein